jgi:hypothetical protein
VAARGQRVTGRLRDAVLDLQHAELALVVVERAERMQRVDPRCLDRVLDAAVEHEDLQQHVEQLLILAVAARVLMARNGLPSFQHDRRRQRRARRLPPTARSG